MLGVLKAGKFYVPLDTFYPRKRNEYILSDTGAELVITNSHNLEMAHELAAGRQLINLDEIDWNGTAEHPRIATAPHDLAYLSYTSGSTGQPKGVIHTHRSLSHNVLRQTNGRHLCPSDRVVLLASYSYVAAASNVFGALLNGAMLLPFNLKEEGLAPLAAWLAREDISIFHTVPTIFRHFVATLSGSQRFPQLRLIRLGGEAVDNRDLEIFRKHFDPNCLLHVAMSSSEAGMILECFFDHQTPTPAKAIPVGYPVEGVDVLLLDDQGRTVEGAGEGEIAVKSRYLCPGYWRRPELTSEVFLADPDGGDRRTYLTRDLGQRLPDGCFVHLGRKDSQVKIQGHRVEISEIELALLALPEMREAVVVSREDDRHGKYLVAYCVPASDPAPTVPELTGHLKERLPVHMVPWSFVMLDALPLLPNGKVDRRALPGPPDKLLELSSQFVAPCTALEKVLAQIWAQVLKRDKVGARDDFLNLGGDSLLAAQIVSRIRDALSVQLPVSSFFKASSLAELAAALLQASGNPAGIEKAAQLLLDLSQLTNQEVEAMLRREKGANANEN
jgi:amino acid adenylation domain-containing protein